MSDEENGSVVAQESQAVAPANESEIAQENPSEQVQQTQDKSKGDQQAYNWGEANRALKELDRRNKLLEQEIAKMKQPNALVDEDVKLTDDELPSYADVKKTLKKSKKDIVEEIRKEVRAEIASATIKLHYPDFDQVVTSENIELLKQQEPELAMSLAHSPDAQTQAVAAYKLLKRTGIGNMPASNPDKEKAVKNTQKPVSVNAVTNKSAIGNAHLFENGLTPELKSQLYKEMRDAAKRA